MPRKSLTDKINREVKYTNKDFGELRRALINHAKNYFPNTYQDFNESSPGMMMIEMAAYVGDVLNQYADTQLQESFLYTVDEKLNLYNLSQGMGYKPKTLVPAQVDLDVMQLVPAIGAGTDVKPDFRYALIIEEGMQCSTEDGKFFRTVEPVDFKYSSSLNPTDISVYSVLPDGTIEYYLLKKCVKAVEGELRTTTFTFTDPKIYDKIVIRDENVSEIVKVTDADGETWYEVPYLAQDLVPDSIRNVPFNDPELSDYRDSAPYLLCYKQTEKRFVTRLRKDEYIEMQFGAGLSQEADEEILPNPYNVALGIDYFRRVEDVSIDPMNFLYTKTYGLAPNDTTLTVQYAISTGLDGNVRGNTINTVETLNVANIIDQVDSTVLQDTIDSVTVNNPQAAYGGLNKKDLDVIREEAMANFAAQNRAVTKDDYILRCYAMPDRFGAIAKAYVEQDMQLSQWNDRDRIQNPYALNLYVLSYNRDGQFTPCNPAIKENLRQYLRQYRLMTDAINIKDPFIINIGIEYEIVTRPNYNSYEVLLRCNNRLIELFQQKNMEINAPIVLAKIRTEIDKLEGVQSVQKIDIVNLYDTNSGYSGNVYSIDEATRNQVIYPSKDPCVFEVKYPKQDIKGRVIDI